MSFKRIIQLVFPFLLIFTSCSEVVSTPPVAKIKEINLLNAFDLADNQMDNNIFYTDTVIAKSVMELVSSIKSDRFIKLTERRFELRSPLLIDGIKNLKIEGGKGISLNNLGPKVNVVKLNNSYNINLDSLIVGNDSFDKKEGETGVLRLENSYNININNTTIFGLGSFGLVSYNINNLFFTNSELTKCSDIMFDLGKSKNCFFTNSQFRNNVLFVSVFGGFTTSTKQVFFENCAFENNSPSIPGNPAFNFMDNTENPAEKIVFKRCRFYNNKGFVWYGEKLKLINCEMDSSDFVRFE